MAIIIKTFSDGTTLDFRTHDIDDWCVFVTYPGKKEKAATNIEIFSAIDAIRTEFGLDKIFADILWIYYNTTKDLEQFVLNQIHSFS